MPSLPNSPDTSDSLLLLNSIKGLGPVTYRNLLERFGSDPSAILAAPKSELRTVRGVGEKIIDSLTSKNHAAWLSKERENLSKRRVFFLGKDSYPPLLNEIYDPPIGLYVGGQIPSGPYISIVGTRSPTLYGLGFVRKLAGQLAEMGFCIVSGMARGIDTAVHEGALDVQGKTLAFLGSGIDVVYPPENLGLYKKILEQGGVASEFPFGRKPDRYTFPKRNRLVAGSSVATLVIESASSGGSLITAQFAADEGRTVFALPGRVDQPSSAGCHRLIRDGATLLRGAKDIVEELGPLLPAFENTSSVTSPYKQEFKPLDLSNEERGILRVLSDGSVLGLDDLCALSHLPPPEVMAGLTSLELNGSISRRPDGLYESK